MVRAEGLEPPRLSPPEPKSGASTSSATPAASAGLTRPICFRRSISACPPCAIIKIRIGRACRLICPRQRRSRWRRDPPRAERGLRHRRARLRRLARRENALIRGKSPRNLGIWQPDAWIGPFRRKPFASIFRAARDAPKRDKWRGSNPPYRSGRRPCGGPVAPWRSGESRGACSGGREHSQLRSRFKRPPGSDG